MTDKIWLNKIYLEYQNLVYSVAVTIIKDAQLAEDIMQEVFVTLYFKYDTIRDQGSIKPWLIRTTVNRTMDFTRKLKRSVALPDNYFAQLEDASLADPAKEIVDREQVQALHLAMEKLPAELKTLVVLAYFLEIPLKEIAATLDLALGTVKTRLRRARLFLRKQLLQQELQALSPEQGVSQHE